MGMLEGLGSFFKRLSPRDIIWPAILVLCLLLLRQCGESKAAREQAAINEQNAIALRDSIVEERTNHERTYNAYKAATVAGMEELRGLNRGLFDRLDSLRRIGRLRGNVFSATDIGAVVSTPGGTVEATVVYVSPEGDVRLTFDIDTAYDADNSRRLTGHADFHLDSMRVSDARFTVDTDVVRVGLTTGITRDDGVYRIFVSSNYPGFSVSRLDGAVLDKKALRSMASDESSVVFGPFLGYGYGFGSAAPTPLVGVGVTYNLNKVTKNLLR